MLQLCLGLGGFSLGRRGHIVSNLKAASELPMPFAARNGRSGHVRRSNRSATRRVARPAALCANRQDPARDAFLWFAWWKGSASLRRWNEHGALALPCWLGWRLVAAGRAPADDLLSAKLVGDAHSGGCDEMVLALNATVEAVGGSFCGKLDALGLPSEDSAAGHVHCPSSSRALDSSTRDLGSSRGAGHGHCSAHYSKVEASPSGIPLSFFSRARLGGLEAYSVRVRKRMERRDALTTAASGFPLPWERARVRGNVRCVGALIPGLAAGSVKNGHPARARPSLWRHDHVRHDFGTKRPSVAQDDPAVAVDYESLRCAVSPK